MSRHLTVTKGGEQGGKPGRVYTCAGCERESFWGPGWRWYGSEALQECCPLLVPKLCSDQCAVEFNRRMAAGEVRLPELTKHFPQRIKTMHHGYYPGRS